MSWIMQITCFHSSGSFILTKQMVNHTDYHWYYYLALLGGLQATEGGTHDASEFDAAHTQV
jgi:hypothetical protein